MDTVTLSFDNGTVIIRGSTRVPNSSWDDRIDAFRAQGLYYSEIVEFLKKSSFPFTDNCMDLVPCPELKTEVKLRTYQKSAIKAWANAEKRGIIVLPTGAGKTVIGMKAIEMVNHASIVLVPTLDLLDQWKTRLEKDFKITIGAYGGGTNTLEGITVSTYDSAYLRAGEIGNKFNLVIFDEVHHLPAEGYRHIAEMFTAPYRLGLTATLEREDMMHRELPRLIGGVVYGLKPSDLAGKYLSNYSIDRINLDLTPTEQSEYDSNYKVFTNYLKKGNVRMRNQNDYRRFIMRTNRDKDARTALLARNKASEIALNSESKILALQNILGSRPNEKVIIFTQHNQLVHSISRRYLLPYITYHTNRDERREILEGFRQGRFRIIVTSKVLDEGIDIPEASLGIIVSGTGSSREFVQRLGRLLRKKEGKEAELIELVSRATMETRTSARRKRKRVA